MAELYGMMTGDETTIAWIERLRRFVDAARWRYAASMPDQPHEYTVRTWYPRWHLVSREFDWFVQTIRDHGYTQRYRRQEYVYLDLDGWRYWTMGAPVEETVVVNRAPSPGLYHSALAGNEGFRLPPLERFEYRPDPSKPPCIARVHDVADGLPEELATCDVVYCEPPWPAGLAEFDRRAGVEPRRYETIARFIAELLWNTDLPIVMTGPRRCSWFPRASRTYEIQLRGRPAALYVYRTDLGYLAPKSTNVDALDAVCRMYERIADPFAGAGLTGRVAARYQRTWVLTDYVPACITYIAMNAAGWYRPPVVRREEQQHADLPRQERTAGGVR